MKKVLTILLTAAAAITVLWFIIPDPTPSYLPDYIPPQQGDDTQPPADQTAAPEAGSFTLMVYIVGSDLESEGGCATMDIAEMLDANLGENVNVVLQTGGTSYWFNDVMEAGACQRFSLRDHELVEERDLGLMSMVEPDAVADFIRWSAAAYPADRYGIIFWDHGGGTLMGFGADEYFPGELTLEDFALAFENGGVHMDFVGFDACLMATIETAYVLAPYADYLIASEETEPGSGWYYTNWLTALGRDPEVDIRSLGAQIVDDYINGPDSTYMDNLTLSVVDLAEIPSLYQSLCTYMVQSSESLWNYGYRHLAEARGEAKAFGEGEFEQVDIADYISLAQVSGGEAVLSQLEEAVVYADQTVSGAYGLAMYYPYDYPEYYGEVLAELESIGLADEHLDYFSEFISVLAFGSFADSYFYEDWFLYDWGEIYEEDITDLDDDLLIFDEKGDGFVLRLTDEQWSQIATIEQTLYVDDGEGYLDLGRDNVYEFDEDGDLIADFDYYWVAINGQIVPFMAVEEGYRPNGSWYSYGYVTAELNGTEDVEVLVYWDEQNPTGYVAGYRPYVEEGLSLPTRYLLEFQPGDTLYAFCDYYNYDGTYNGSYYIGDVVACGYDGFQVAYEMIEDYTVLFGFRLTDHYQNEYWTELIEYYY